MKTFTNIGLFLLMYFMLTLIVYILSFDVLSWHTIARDPMMLLFGGITSFMTIVAYRLEKEQED
jgi:hypothetical protein